MEVYIGSRELSALDVGELSEGVSYCPQEDAMWPRVSAREQLLFFARLRGLAPPDAAELVDVGMRALKIDSYANRMYCELSGGTKRMVYQSSLSDSQY